MSPPLALLVPVKTLTRAKSRLADAPRRADLMVAFARDAIEAALACPAVSRVLVVTDQPDYDRLGLASSSRVTRIADEGAGDLNAAIRAAALAVRLDEPATAVAAMLADLPCLRADDLADGLAAGLAPRWFVADAAGTGTTLLVAGPGVDLDPHFGVDSAARHERSGAVPVRAEVPTLRRDVDTDEDLEVAVALGVGRATASLLVGSEPS